MNEFRRTIDFDAHFTKQDVLLNHQCAKAAWLTRHQSELAAPPSEGVLLRLEQGQEVDAVAQDVYLGGTAVPELQWIVAMKKTQRLIEKGVKRLYQAAFEYNGLRVRTDIIDINTDGSVVLREVKMSTKVKPEHKLDLATQVYVIKGTGFVVRKALIVYINANHAELNYDKLFLEKDVTKEALEYADSLHNEIASIPETLRLERAPEIRVGKHCKRPRQCPFYDHCWKDVPSKTVINIPRLSDKKVNALLDGGILELGDIPSTFNLTDTQWKYIEDRRATSPSIDVQSIHRILDRFEYPLHFLDFETYGAPIPLFKNSKPYQPIPFQFSLHILYEEGTLVHHGYLHTTYDDPREAIASKLLQYMEDKGTILAYHAPFEKRVLLELSERFPSLQDRLQEMASRLYDQLVLMKNYVKHPELGGSYSLKNVTRVLLPEHLSYEGLTIANGESAQAAWIKMITLEGQEKERVCHDLAVYCKLDTMAQVALHQWCSALSA